MPIFWLTFDMTELTWDDQESWLSTITPRRRISVTTFTGVPQSRMGGVLGKWLLFLADGQMSKAADFSTLMGRPRSTNSPFMMLRAAPTCCTTWMRNAVPTWFAPGFRRLQLSCSAVSFGIFCHSWKLKEPFFLVSEHVACAGQHQAKKLSCRGPMRLSSCFRILQSSIRRPKRSFLKWIGSPSEFSKVADTSIYLSKNYFWRDWGGEIESKENRKQINRKAPDDEQALQVNSRLEFFFCHGKLDPKPLRISGSGYPIYTWRKRIETSGLSTFEIVFESLRIAYRNAPDSVHLTRVRVNERPIRSRISGFTTCHVSVSMERTNQKLWSAMWYWAIPPVIDHTRSIDLWPSGTKWTGDLPVSHVVWHNTSMGGIMPYHMAGKFEKRTRAYGPGKAVFHCGIPKSVRMKMSLTSSNDSRHCKWKSLKFWSKNVLRKKVQTKRAIKSRSRPGVGRERILWDHSLNVILQFLTVCHSMS